MRWPLSGLGLLLGIFALLAMFAFPSAPAVFYGRVVAAKEGVAGARVRLQATANEALTGTSGRFRLTGSAETRKITAWHDGFFIGSVRPDSSILNIRLSPLPEMDHADYVWVDPDPDPARPQNCGNCHREIYQEWRHSGHSRSITGKHFRNLYEGTDFSNRPGVGWGLLTQYDLGAAVCFSCHAPALPDTAPAALDWDRPADPVALHGVHCDYCHKIAAAGHEKLGLNHGRYNLQLLRPPPARPEEEQRQVFFGPLDDVDRGEDVYSPLSRQSLYCASCHEGTVFGVHVYSTWSEWLASPARRQGQQCQDCHMKPTGRMSNIAPGRGGLQRDPATLANHRFFADGQAEMLRRCVQVSARWHDGHVTLRIGVNGVGHRVPTGLPDRHLLLVLEGLDSTGQPLPLRSGPTLPPPAGPELAGRPGRLYAKLLHDRNGNSPAPFWQAEADCADNRLTPGLADEMNLTFSAAPAQLRVRVVYRRFWDEVIRNKGWPDRDLVVLDQHLSPPGP